MKDTGNNADYDCLLVLIPTRDSKKKQHLSEVCYFTLYKMMKQCTTEGLSGYKIEASTT